MPLSLLAAQVQAGVAIDEGVVVDGVPGVVGTVASTTNE